MIEFYFDFSSPYGYFAATRIDALGARLVREVAWRPIMIGSAFKASGNLPLVHQPMKGDYSRRDWKRMARLWEVPYRLPDPFPIATLAAARAFWWLNEEEPTLAHRFAQAIFHAYFAEGRNVSSPPETAAVGAACGVRSSDLLAAVEDPRWKQRLKDETEAAIAKGVFGSPFIIVDGEGFWGADRLEMAEEWAKRGGW